MPSSEVQMHLIDLFFETRYKTTPIIPKHLFYEQLRVKGPLVTPLLLNAIYCSASAFSTLPNVPKPSVFYNRAKSLLDDFLDTPRISTVAALCILSLYEPTHTKTDEHCRSWIYSGMGFRMCLELGLNMDTPHSRGDFSIEGIELRRRVFWVCYCLDKLQSAEWERLWSLPSSLAKTALPQSLPGDDEDEQCIVKVYRQKIKLLIIAERGLQVRASFAVHGGDDREQFNEQLRQYRLNILQWKNNLPSSPGLWEFRQCNTVDDVINEPKKSPMLAHLQAIYYFMLIDTFFFLPFEASVSLEHRIYASQLTRCVESLCEQPRSVVRYEFLAHALIAAIRAHSRYLSHPDPLVEYQSLNFFNDSVSLLRKLKSFAIIPECSAILQHIPTICQNSRTASQRLYQDSAAATIESPFDDAQVSNFSQLNANGNLKQCTQVIQPNQELNDNCMIDPYKATSLSHEISLMDSLLTASPFNSLNAFGSSIGVDFGDRRQLWEFAIQEASQYDVMSTPTTPEETAHYNTVSATTTNDWTSPCSVEFNWPNPIIDQTRHHSPSVSLNELPPCNQQPYNSRSSSPHQQQQQSFIQPLVSYTPIPTQSPFVQQHHIANTFQFNQEPVIPPHSQLNFSSISSQSQHVYYPN
jgi:hypothetical protein